MKNQIQIATEEKLRTCLVSRSERSLLLKRKNDLKLQEMEQNLLSTTSIKFTFQILKSICYWWKQTETQDLILNKNIQVMDSFKDIFYILTLYLKSIYKFGWSSVSLSVVNCWKYS